MTYGVNHVIVKRVLKEQAAIAVGNLSTENIISQILKDLMSTEMQKNTDKLLRRRKHASFTHESTKSFTSLWIFYDQKQMAKSQRE